MGNDKIIGTAELARQLGLKESSVRRLVIRMHEAEGIGQKISERAWAFTPTDVERLRAREDRRGDWQKGGGRKRYLEDLKAGIFTPKNERPADN